MCGLRGRGLALGGGLGGGVAGEEGQGGQEEKGES